VQLLALREAALAISADLSLAETLKRIVLAAAQLVNARYAALGVPDESGETLAEFITTGLSQAEEARISHRPRGHGILGVILHEGQSLRLKNLQEHPRSYGFPAHHPAMDSFLGVPITYKNHRLGNLYLTNKQGADEFTADDQRLIEFLAAHAGIAIENARLHEKMQQLIIIEERQRIGMDLHDGVIQSIYGAELMLESLSGQLAEGPRQKLQQVTETLNSAIRDIRTYILDLRPRQFEGDNLVNGLRQLISEFKANTLLSVEFTAEAEADQALSPQARLAFFHIAQEALSNAAKHSRASRIEVNLSLANHSVHLTLRDNGQGFNPQQTDRRVGHGLRNMQDRSRGVGANFQLGPGPNGLGTEINVSLPVANPG
jgi:signal transduction histidine kinase